MPKATYNPKFPYNFDRMMRTFKKSVEKSGILDDMRKREFYEKPAAVRVRRKAAAKKREQRRVRELNLNRPSR